MTSNYNNENTDTWVQWIEEDIAKRYINYHNYDEFKNIKHIDSGTLNNYLKDNFNKPDWNIKFLFAIQISDTVSTFQRPTNNDHYK
ncbi:hypothetical protein C1645_839073 [Glomus cerebriforme]|uniref:Uncharacterized protein n=1 Tax=Glomus cerebriforme TaxID=658196 RepID=A0A397S7D7_9GLOM|nr:hypothetical protein C1645_839073 [Glomus cerebriforme]